MNSQATLKLLVLLFPFVLNGCLDSSNLSGSSAAAATSTGCTSGNGLTNSSILVNFQFPSGYDKVVISRDGVEVGNSNSSDVTSFIDTGLTEGMTYRYTCDAYIGARRTAGATFLDLSPVNTNAPTFAGIVSATTTGPHSMTVTWSPEGNAGAKATYYQIFVSAGNTVVWPNTAKQTIFANGTFSATITGLGDEMPYSAGVRACTQKNICDTNAITKTVITPDGGQELSEGISAVTAGNLTAYISAPWKDSDGGLAERRVFVCTGTGCTFGATPVKVYPVTTSQIAVPPTNLTVDNILENTTYRFLVVDVDPSGNINASTTPFTLVTGDLSAPLFGGITNAAVVAPKDSTVGLSFVALNREGVDVPVGTTGATTDYLLYQTSALYPGVPSDSCLAAVSSQIISAAVFSPGVAAYNVTNLNPRTNYSFCLRARDAAGNISTNSTSSSVTTWDITAPTFGGIQSLTFNAATKNLQVVWNQSPSPDLRNYIVKFWKNTANPTSAQISSFLVDASNTSGKTFSVNDYAVVGNDVVYAIVDACDNTGDLGLGIADNCTTSATSSAKYVLVPDITPPQGFPGISPASSLASSVEGQALIKWGHPTVGYDGDYQGFKVYSVDPSSAALSLLATCPCTTPGACSAVILGDNQCTIAGLNPGRIYRLHVRAYDASGNVTDYLNPTLNYSDLRIKDSTAPGFVSNLSVSGLNFSWNAATDNQFTGTDVVNNPPNQITYTVYRKFSSTFAAPTNPSTDGALVISQNTTSYFESSLGVAGTYYYTICAADSQGNNVCDGTVRSISVADIIPPTISSFNSTTKSTTDKILKKWNLSWTVSDNISTAANLRVRIYKKSGTSTVVAATTDTKIFDGYATTTTLPNLSGDVNSNGYIDYLLWVQDEVGNVSTAHYKVISNNLITVTTITDNRALTTGNRAIVLYGSGFTSGSQNGFGTDTTIKIGTQNCNSITFVATDYVYCTVPAQSAGSYIVTVSNPDGSTNTTQSFTYLGSSTGDCLDTAYSTPTSPAGTGSSVNPFIVCNLTQLSALSTSTSWGTGFFAKLGNNIDLAGGTFRAVTLAMNGTLDGQGFGILNNTYLFTGTSNIDMSFFKIKIGSGLTSTFKNIKFLKFNQGINWITSNGLISGTATAAWGCATCSVFNALTSSTSLILDNFVYIGQITPPTAPNNAGDEQNVGVVPSLAPGNLTIRNNSDLRLTINGLVAIPTTTIGGGGIAPTLGTVVGVVGKVVGSSGYYVQNSKASVTLSNLTLCASCGATAAGSLAGVVYGVGATYTVSNTQADFSVTRADPTTTGNCTFSALLAGRVVNAVTITASQVKGTYINNNENCPTAGNSGGFFSYTTASPGQSQSISVSDSYLSVQYPNNNVPNRSIFGVTATGGTAGSNSIFVMNRVWADVSWIPGGGVAKLSPTVTSYDSISSTGLIYNADVVFGASVGTLGVSTDIRANLQTQGTSNLFVTNGYDFTAVTGKWQWCPGVVDYPKLSWESCN